MGTETEERSAFGIRSSIGWPLGGALGGALGAAAMGLLFWLLDPAIVRVAIPSFYGLDPVGVVGWTIHVANGVVLGLVFGLIISREPILGIVRTSTETEAISAIGLVARIVGGGVAYGLAIWAILPVLVLPAVADGTAGGFPTTAVESLVGHVLFGLILGIVFAVTIDVRDRSPDSPLEG